MKTKSYAVPEGCKITSVTIENNNVVVSYECEKQEFKKGDFVTYEIMSTWISIYGNDKRYLFTINSLGNVSETDNKMLKSEHDHRLATPDEKQLLISKMRENGKDWDEEKCEVVDYVERITKGYYYWEVVGGLNCDIKFHIIENKHTEDIALFYDKSRFKTEQLAQIACDNLNELFKTLKHY
jgi:hypothetical protein